MAEKSLLETINEAIAPDAPDPAPVVEDPPEGETPPEGEKPEGETPPEGEKPEGETPPEGEKPLEGEQTDEEKAAAEAAAIEAAKAQTPEQKVEADKKRAEARVKEQIDNPVDAPIPRDLKPETQQRMRALVKSTKELRTQVDKAIADRDELISIVQDTGATPQQFGAMLTLVKQINSSAPADQEQALSYLLKAAEELSRKVGKPMPGVNMLKDHADLMTEVQNGVITRARAEEIAALREARKAQDRNAQERSQADQRTQAVASGKAQLTALGNELSARDGEATYTAKSDVLIKALKPVLQTADPANWGAIFRAAYDAVPSTGFLPVTPKPAAKPPVPDNQPLRARTPAGGQQKAPGSMLEAVNQALAGAA